MSRPTDRNRKGRTASPAYLRLVQENTPLPAPPPAGGPSARDRIEIVPLDEPRARPATPVARPATLAPHDRRQEWPGRQPARDAAARLVCPRCHIPARVDVVDLRTKRLHLSCDRCFRMWQDRVRAGDALPAGLQRVR